MIHTQRVFASHTQRVFAACCLVLALACITVSAQKPSQNQAVIVSAVPDLTGEVLFITGQNLPAAPVVTFGLIPLAIELASSTQISATLPFNLHPPGTYLLTVQSSRNNGSVNYATFDVTLGNVGPAGAIGPTGPAGPPGPPGSATTLPAVMCPAGFYLQGINADGTPACVDLNPDLGRPTVSLNPFDQGGGCTTDANNPIFAGFSEPMDASTINSATFTLSLAGSADLIPGTVTFHPEFNVWIFTPQTPLANGVYTTTVTTGAKDLSGKSLKTNVTATWGHFCAAACVPSPEVCDGIDNDCDNQIDEDLVLPTFFKDLDQDGFGTPNEFDGGGVVACSAFGNFTSLNSLDCNDGSAAMHPGLIETCDGIDNNCSGQVDEACVVATPQLTVTKVGSGDGTVTSSPSGINCGAACVATFITPTIVTLMATASAGSTFVTWVGDCVGGVGTCTLTMDVARNVTAVFEVIVP